jgi:hypothetical protein
MSPPARLETYFNGTVPGSDQYNGVQRLEKDRLVRHE